MMNLTHIAEQAKRVTRQQDQEIMKLKLQNDAFKRKQAILEQQMSRGMHLAHVQQAALRAERHRADVLGAEFNSTLQEEAAEQATNQDLERENADLEKEVSALRGERQRLVDSLK